MDDKKMRGTVAAIINNEGRSIPALADLPARWDLLEGNEKERGILLTVYRAYAERKHWAWEGLRRLLDELVKRGEPLPDPLKLWACRTVLRDPPRSWGETEDINYRTLIAFDWLRKNKVKRDDAFALIADANNEKTETVRSRVRNAEKLRKDPFTR